MELYSLLPLSSEIFLSIAGMVLLVWGAFAGNKAMCKISIATCLAFILAIGALHHQVGVHTVLLGGHIGVDGFSLFVKVLLLLSALAALLMSQSYLKHSNTDQPEYPVLMLFATLGMMLMVSAESFLGLYVGLELQSLALYVMAAFKRDQAKSSEAGLKYFVLGALASGLLLYGISLLYGASGTVLFSKFYEMSVVAKPPVEMILGMVFVLAAIAFKISAVPFHMWAPDVYEGAPTPVTAFFAAAPKLAAFAVLIKLLMGPFLAMAASAQQIIVMLAVGSMVLGAFAAIAQSNLKRLMAYSSIGHVGYMLTGMVAGNEQGVAASLLYLLIYLPMTLGAFAMILSLRRGDTYLENISDLAGLSKTRPVMAAMMSVFMFSMVGVPPLAGFFGKLYVLGAAVSAGFVWLAVLGVVVSVVSAYYYLRIIKVMYFDAPSSPSLLHFEAVEGFGPKLVSGATTLFTMGFIVWPEPFVIFAQNAAKALLQY